eukprot:gene4651-5695_t
MDQNIKVIIRARPPAQQSDDQSAWKLSGDTIALDTKNPFTSNYAFDRIYGAESQSKHLYEFAIKNMVEKAADGINGTVFAYGQTGSGKTHTIRGTSFSPGLMPQAISDLFAFISQTESDRQYTVKVSYIEIYNEEIRDLLNPSAGLLKLRLAKEGHFEAVAVTETTVETPAEVFTLMDKGDTARTVGSTRMNAHSSRSHAMFRLQLQCIRLQGENAGSVMRSQMNFVDLAGSERQSKTGAEGKQQKEANAINKSLLVLSNCIEKLSERKKGGHIPYRDSSLTRLLMTALGGNSNTTAVCNIHLSKSHKGETESTLRFASRCKKVVNNAVVNEVVSEKEQIASYQKTMELLQKQVSGGEVDGINGQDTGQEELQKTREEDRVRREQLEAKVNNMMEFILAGKETMDTLLEEDEVDDEQMTPTGWVGAALEKEVRKSSSHLPFSAAGFIQKTIMAVDKFKSKRKNKNLPTAQESPQQLLQESPQQIDVAWRGLKSQAMRKRSCSSPMAPLDRQATRKRTSTHVPLRRESSEVEDDMARDQLMSLIRTVKDRDRELDQHQARLQRAVDCAKERAGATAARLNKAALQLVMHEESLLDGALKANVCAVELLQPKKTKAEQLQDFQRKHRLLKTKLHQLNLTKRKVHQTMEAEQDKILMRDFTLELLEMKVGSGLPNSKAWAVMYLFLVLRPISVCLFHSGLIRPLQNFKKLSNMNPVPPHRSTNDPMLHTSISSYHEHHTIETGEGGDGVMPVTPIISRKTGGLSVMSNPYYGNESDTQPLMRSDMTPSNGWGSNLVFADNSDALTSCFTFARSKAPSFSVDMWKSMNDSSDKSTADIRFLASTLLGPGRRVSDMITHDPYENLDIDIPITPGRYSLTPGSSRYVEDLTSASGGKGHANGDKRRLSKRLSEVAAEVGRCWCCCWSGGGKEACPETSPEPTRRIDPETPGASPAPLA